MILDIRAPIIPYDGFGEIKLYSTIMELDEILTLSVSKKKILNDNWIIYDIQNSIELFFHRKNDKLFRITTLDNYKGKVFGSIGVGTTLKEMLSIESSFVYYEFEELWQSDKGAFIEMDPVTNKVRWISVYIHELEEDNFEQCLW
ncbi:MAG: hypothetical protein Q4F95_08605 [Oscillospiraceae bacterium]|nr:hypothetical protein [Oscillospiraceae bacterium]